MLILLTNDDGITAPGLVAMYHELKKLGEVRVVAPETVQSATGHGITLSTPLITSQVTVAGAFTGTAVEGRPADCVKLAVAKLLPRQPDLVVSGINSGANVGINVIYSGTVAAAIEAAFLGLPAIAAFALSAQRYPCRLRPHRKPGRRSVIEIMLARGCRAGQVASVNIPPLRPDEESDGREGRPPVRSRRGCDTYEERRDPRGRAYFWNSSVFSLGKTEADTDVAALRDGYITVTPLQFDLTHYPLMREWESREWSFGEKMESRI